MKNRGGKKRGVGLECGRESVRMNCLGNFMCCCVVVWLWLGFDEFSDLKVCCLELQITGIRFVDY